MGLKSGEYGGRKSSVAPVAAMKLFRLRRFVKGCILQDDEVLGVEARAQPCLQPGVEDHRIARALDEQRLVESPFHTGHNQRGPWPSMPGAQTVHTLALRGVPIPSRCRSGKAAFVDMDGPFATVNEPFSQTQEPFPLLRITFLVDHSFFEESLLVCGVGSRCKAETPGNAAPVPRVFDREEPPHDGAIAPNPPCENREGLDACRPRRQA